MKINHDYLRALRGGYWLNKIIFKEVKYGHIFSNILWFTLATLIVLFIFSSLLLVSCDNAHASSIPDKVAINCIIGEASGEGALGMIYLASALYNRGTTKGVYGCKAGHTDTEPEIVQQQASYAWQQAKKHDSVRRATYWASTRVDRAWIRKMRSNGFVMTLSYKNHEFYREGR